MKEYEIGRIIICFMIALLSIIYFRFDIIEAGSIALVLFGIGFIVEAIRYRYYISPNKLKEK